MRNRSNRLQFESLETRRLLAAEPLVDSFSTPDINDSRLQDSEQVTGLRAASIEIRYDPATTTFDQQSFKPGTAWEGRASLIANIDEAIGSVSIFIFSTRPIEDSGGSLLDLDLDTANTQDGNGVGDILVNRLNLNEGQIQADPVVVEPTVDSDALAAREGVIEAPPKRISRSIFAAPPVDDTTEVRACAPYQPIVSVAVEPSSVSTPVRATQWPAPDLSRQTPWYPGLTNAASRTSLDRGESL